MCIWKRNVGTLGISQNLAVLRFTLLRWHPVVQKRSIAPHQRDGQLLEEARNFLWLVLSGVPCLGTAKLFDLGHSSLVPCSQGLNSERNKGDAFPAAGFPGLV